MIYSFLSLSLSLINARLIKVHYCRLGFKSLTERVKDTDKERERERERDRKG